MNPTRRQFIRRSALGTGALALAPFIRQLEANAAGRAEALPKRFVFVIKSSGLTPEGIRPLGVELGDRDRLIDQPMQNLKLPPTLQSLEPFKDQVMILEGLSGANFQGNHSSYYGALSCHHSPDKPVAPTLDCLLGALNPAPFRI
jgi:hypothetical protein